jgi:uncharacterized protein (TIGR03437 family)
MKTVRAVLLMVGLSDAVCGLEFEPRSAASQAADKFLARGSGYTVLVGSSQARICLRSPSGVAYLQMNLAGAGHSQGHGEHRLPGVTHYYTGHDPKNWRSSVPRFQRVVFPHVYPGVDLHYYGHGSGLEYDFVVGPHADPSLIEIDFGGASQLTLSTSGDLQIHTPAGIVTQGAPVVYQRSPDGHRQPVVGRYVFTGQSRVRFALGPYDRSRPLIIDPVIVYSTVLGGSLGREQGQSATRDRAGNIWVVGTMDSDDFPTAPGQALGRRGRFDDGVVMKFDPSGRTRLFTLFVGGQDGDQILDVDTDAAGNAYVTGVTTSFDFPTTSGAFQREFQQSFPRRSDSFVVKIGPTGAIVYSTLFGGLGDEVAFSIAVDPASRAYIAGTTGSREFPGSTIIRPAVGGATDAFVARFNAAGSQLLQLAFIGGNAAETANALAFDPNGNVVLTGITRSPDFPSTPGAFQSVPGGKDDAFAAKLTPALQLVWMSPLGAAEEDVGYAIAATAGAIYVAGLTESPSFPVSPGAFQRVFRGEQDVFVATIKPDGSAILNSTLLGGGDFDRPSTINVDAAGSCYLTGITASVNFPVTQDAAWRQTNGELDIFIAQLNSTLTSLIYSSYLGGNRDDYHWWGRAGFDPTRRQLVLTGESYSTTFPTTRDNTPNPFPLPPNMHLTVVELPPTPLISSVEDGASFRPEISAASWVTIRGAGLAPTTRIWRDSDFSGSNLPTVLDGVRVTIDGRPTAVYYISPTQLNVLAGALTRTGSVPVTVTTPAGSDTFTATVRARTPSWFMLDPENRRYVAAVLPDGVIAGKPGLFTQAPNATRPLPSGGARALIYGTGWGPSNPPQPEGRVFSGALPLVDAASVRIRIGGVPVVVEFAGVVTPGLYQFNIVSPNLTPGDYPIEGSVNGAATPPGAFITIGPPR